MIGFFCKYAPVEIFEAMGVEIGRIEPKVTNFNQADTLMHPNICSFAKAVLEDVVSNDYEGVVLTTCCDSVRRLYDVLRNRFPEKFIYLLDVPRKVTDFAVGLYSERLEQMISAYEQFSGRTFDRDTLAEILKRKEEGAQLKTAPRQEGKLHIGLMGARCSAEVKNLLEDHHVDVVFDLTCTGISRHYRVDSKNLMHSYAEELLNQIPCMRMTKAVNRENYIEGFLDRIDGILYHTVKFCDNYSYEYTRLHQELEKPILLVETDATLQCAGQIRTRVEAFLESLEMTKGNADKKRRKKQSEDGKMYVLGIDSGSTSTNAVIMNEKREIVAFSVVRTGAKSGDSANRILQDVLEKAKLDQQDLDLIVSTGYGRVSIPFADETVTEISCHGKGAHYFNPAVRTILDIGGQDSKAIQLNEKGEVTDFVMNDKCAAGTGRFLEMMARTLEIDIAELGPISLEWTEDIDISSMCSVFAESEVISLIAQNKEKCDIAHGIHKAIAGKACSLLKRVGQNETFMMTGGVAKNPGVVRAVEEVLHTHLYLCDEPEIVGATGAALFALESLEKE
jgi:predicted CoA-substrate-specific enzyme activase